MHRFKNLIPVLCVLSGLWLWSGCAASSEEPVDPAYRAEFEAWHTERVADLTGPRGWFNLVGLHWLQEGENTFGSSPENDVVFPDGTPLFMGVFKLDSTGVQVVVDPDAEVLHEGKRVDTLALENDDGTPTVLTHGSFRWYVIDRDGRTGIRIRDTESEQVKSFSGIDLYPLRPSWKVEAVLEPYDTLRAISIPTILGTDRPDITPGRLAFEYAGETYRLTPVLREKGTLFVVFADQTTNRETYGGGRFLDLEAPDENGRVVIDFNRAYNPPCVFSVYSTCPQPPAENRLAVAVTAGEKMYNKP